MQGTARANSALTMSRESIRVFHEATWGRQTRPRQIVKIPSIMMKDGRRHPLVGYGTYKVGYIPATASEANEEENGECDDAEKIVLNALRLGYRFIDCAQFYGNEAAVGRAILRSGIERSDLFLASKVWCDNIYDGHRAVQAQVARSLRDLQTDYLDLYLIHWPVPGKHVSAYHALEPLCEKGKIRSIGLSNYTIKDYKELLEAGIRILPAVNQIEVNPFLYRKETIDFFQSEGVVIQAYRALRQGKQLCHPLITALARKYQKTPAQILGRWCVERGVIYITKSVKIERMVENANIFDFSLDKCDTDALGSLTTAKNVADFKALYRKCVVRDTPLECRREEVEAGVEDLSAGYSCNPGNGRL